MLDGQYAENLERNIISYGLLERKGFEIEYRGPCRVIAAMAGGPAVFDVQRTNNVLMVHAVDYSSEQNAGDVLVSVLANSQAEVGTLMHFHRRLGHLN